MNVHARPLVSSPSNSEMQSFIEVHPPLRRRRRSVPIVSSGARCRLLLRGHYAMTWVWSANAREDEPNRTGPSAESTIRACNARQSLARRRASRATHARLPFGNTACFNFNLSSHHYVTPWMRKVMMLCSVSDGLSPELVTLCT